MVKVSKMLDQMIAARKTLLAYARAASLRTWEIGNAHAVYSRLVSLEIG
jgi:hypothetical protein